MKPIENLPYGVLLLVCVGLLLFWLSGPTEPGDGADTADRAPDRPALPYSIDRLPAAERPVELPPKRHRAHAADEEDLRVEQEQDEAAAQEEAARRVTASSPAPEGEVLVPVVITFHSGRPPLRIHVAYRRAGVIGSSRWSDTRPVIALRPGGYDVRVVAGQLGRFRSEWQQVEVPASGAAPVVRFRVSDSGGVFGRIVFPRDEATAWPVVRLRRHEPELGGDILGTTPLPPEHEFAFTGLSAGRYVVYCARHRGAPSAVEIEVDVGDHSVRRDLHVPKLRRDEYVVVRVLGPDGNGIEDAVVRLGRLGARGVRWRSHGVLGGKGGVYRALTDGVAADPDRLAVIVMAPGLGRRVEPLSESGEVTVRMLELAHLDVEVAPHAASEGKDAVFAVALDSAVESRTLSRVMGSRPADEPFAPTMGARRSLDGVQPGEHVVLVLTAMPNDPGHFVEVLRKPITLSSGANSVTLSVPPLHTVEVRLDAKSGYAMLFRPGDPDPWRMAATDDGTIRFFGLSAGSYRVVLADHRKRSIEVPRDAVVTFEEK